MRKFYVLRHAQIRHLHSVARTACAREALERHHGTRAGRFAASQRRRCGAGGVIWLCSHVSVRQHAQHHNYAAQLHANPLRRRVWAAASNRSQFVRTMQGLLTKDVTPLGKPQAAPLYAALLNAKGRFVHELVLHRDERAESSGIALLLDCPAPAIDQLAGNLTRFKLRADVSIEKATSDLHIVARWSRGLPSISDWDLPDPPGASALTYHVHVAANVAGYPPFVCRGTSKAQRAWLVCLALSNWHMANLW